MVSEHATGYEEQRAHGIAAMGRVERDEDGFTVYSTATPPDAYRVWEDPHAGTRCSCERAVAAFRAGDEYRCEHVLAVALWLDPPEDGEERTAEADPVRRIV
jgi:hypothetical protein